MQHIVLSKNYLIQSDRNNIVSNIRVVQLQPLALWLPPLSSLLIIQHPIHILLYHCNVMYIETLWFSHRYFVEFLSIYIQTPMILCTNALYHVAYGFVTRGNHNRFSLCWNIESFWSALGTQVLYKLGPRCQLYSIPNSRWHRPGNEFVSRYMSSTECNESNETHTHIHTKHHTFRNIRINFNY